MFCFNWVSLISFITFSESWEFLYETCPGPWKLVCVNRLIKDLPRRFSSPHLLASCCWVTIGYEHLNPWLPSTAAVTPRHTFQFLGLHQAKGCLWGTHACHHVALDFLLSLWLALSTSLPTLSKIFFLDNLVIAISTLAAASLYTHQTLYTHFPCYYYHSGVLYCYIAALQIHHTRKWKLVSLQESAYMEL